MRRLAPDSRCKQDLSERVELGLPSQRACSGGTRFGRRRVLTSCDRMTRRRVLIPWWRLASAALLTAALAISATAGRVIESIIIAILLLPTFAFLVLWIVAWRRGQLDGGESA